MSWCYDCIFQGVWKNGIGNAIIIIFKNKFQKISEFSLIRFVGMPVLCMALFVLRLLISFMTSSRSTWEKPKDKPKLQVFFFPTMLGWNPFFVIAFTSVVSHWFRYIILGNPYCCYDIREKLFQNRCSVFIIYCNLAILFESDSVIINNFIW